MPFAIVRNDLSRMNVDAIVVAANEGLQITGGVGATVAEAAGFEQMQAACNEIGSCRTGGAVATPGFALAAKVVVHAVGPIWEGGVDQTHVLREAYDSALACAWSEGARSVALPLLSAGTYGYPPEVSLSTAREAIRAFLETHDCEVTLVLYDREAVAAGIAEYGEIASFIDDRYVEEVSAAGSVILSEAQLLAPCASPAASPVSPKRRRGVIERLAGAFAGAADKASAPAERADYDSVSAESAEDAEYAEVAGDVGLDEWLSSIDEPFSTTLLALIDARGLIDAQVYKRANMSRQHFSKIRNDASYRPTKKTVLGLSVALELDLAETQDLLRRAGFALSPSSKADLIVEYFIRSRNYDIFAINEALYAFDQPLL